MSFVFLPSVCIQSINPKMKLSILMLVSNPVIHGFLLDHSVPPSVGVLDKQFISASEFYAAKKEQHHTTEVLRQDMDKTFELLTSQLEQKLTSFDSKIQNNQELKKNNTISQSQLEILIQKQSALENKMLLIEKDNAKLKSKINSLENITVQQGITILSLQQLKNIQPLREVKALQQRVNALSSETYTLSVNELARRQDLLALYNKTDHEFRASHNRTISLQTKTTNLAAVYESQLNMTNNRLNLTNNQLNLTINQLIYLLRDQNITSSELNTSISVLKTELNTKKESLDKGIDAATQKVAITSCFTKDKILQKGEIIKFEDVVTHVGISNMRTFTNSGKLTCPVSGLYHVSVYVFSSTSKAQYAIYRNNNVISKVFISSHTEHWNHLGTGVVTLLLQAGNTVWIQTLSNMQVGCADYSCLSILKIM